VRPYRKGRGRRRSAACVGFAMKRALPAHMTLPVIFGVAFATGFSGAATPGSLLFMVIQKAVQFGWLAGPVMMIGHGVLELVAVVLLTTGLIRYARASAVRGIIGVTGGLVLLLLAYLSFGISPKAVTQAMAGASGGLATAMVGPRQALELVGLGAAMSVTNPYWWLWWATIGTAHTGWATQRGRLGGGTYLTGHVLADVVWYSAISIALGLGQAFLSHHVLRGIYVGSAAFLAAMGLMFVVAGARSLARRQQAGAESQAAAEG
jgi:threonine/homoserine/homoserine lactone efflux protein